jgi:F0F1-type ATP synthase assembly protein I
MMSAIRFQVFLIVLCVIGVTVAVLLDLASGVRKAKQNGNYIYSYKMRRTVDKFLKYYSFMALAAFFDIIQMLCILNINEQADKRFVVTPIFVLLVTLICFLIEIKSIKEKASVKQQKEIDEGMQTFLKIMKAMSSKEMNELIDTINKVRNGKEECE